MRQVWFILTLALSASFSSVAVASSGWDNAGECFNSGDFDCAYDAALELNRAGKIVVGHDGRTTDSMTFFQMAYMEKAARVSTKETMQMAGQVITDFGTVRSRLPFLWVFVIIASHEACGENEECTEKFMHIFCQVKDQIPAPSWRSLHNLNDLSGVGRNYFERVMVSFKPECRGA